MQAAQAAAVCAACGIMTERTDKDMAGTMVHMLTTKKILERLGGGAVSNIPSFYVGSFAPDAIHVRKGYKREWKMRTHLREQIADDVFAREENLALFHSRLKQFAEEELGRCVKGSAEYDFYRGYAAHLLTDELFMRTVRIEFMDRIAGIGLTQYQPETFIHFTHDVNQIDFRIAAEEEGMQEVYRQIKEAPVFEVRNFLDIKEIEASRQWVLNMYYDSHPSYTPPVYLQYGRMLQFAEEAADYVVKTAKKDYLMPDFNRQP